MIMILARSLLCFFLSPRSKLPGWVLQFLDESHLNMSADNAAAMARMFLKVRWYLALSHQHCVRGLPLPRHTSTSQVVMAAATGAHWPLRYRAHVQ